MKRNSHLMCLPTCNALHAIPRRGVTPVELLVVVAVVTVLMSLLLPAVQSARESARMTQCRNNLHQVGIAMHSFHDQHGFIDVHRPLRSILPHIDQAPLHQRFEEIDSLVTQGLPVDYSGVISPGSYLCPTDFAAKPEKTEISYWINGGSTIGRSSGVHNYQTYQKPFRFSLVTDGLANTALMAEKLVQFYPDPASIESVARSHPLRFSWSILREFPPGNEAELRQYCLDPQTLQQTVPGVQLSNHIFLNGSEQPYHHLLNPNSWSFSPNGRYDGPIAASSLHSGGAMLLLLDGSVRFISSNIDYTVYWALGTVNSGDMAGN